jgi:putative DNA primase/helicase
LTATEALIAIGYDRPNRAQVREASAVLQKLTGGEARRTAGGKKRVFDLPPKLLPGEVDTGVNDYKYEDEKAF